MATSKKRLALALTDAQYDLLSRLSKLQRRSRAAIVVELLEQVQPVLERVVVVGEAAQRAQVQAKEGLRESMERAEAAILPHISAAMGQFDLLLDDVSKGLATEAQGVPPTHTKTRNAAGVRGVPGGRGTPVSVTTGVRSRQGGHRKRSKAAVRRAGR